MRFRKTASAAVVLVLAAMAVVSPAAQANAPICTDDARHQNGELCGSHGKHAKNPLSLSMSLIPGTKTVERVTNNSGETVRVVECAKSNMAGTLTNTATGTGSISSVTYSECTSAGCTNVTAKAPAAGKSNVWPTTMTTTTQGVSNTNGLYHTSNMSTSFTATCLFITATCEYEAATATKHLSGGSPAVVHLVSVPLTKIAGSEAICGTKLDVTATYEVTTPASVYVL
jgi:hypothetical protein